MAPTIRVLIVDDVQESRDNVERLLRFEPDIQIVGSASRGQEAIELTLRHTPDIVLMDVNMPDMDGIQATRTIMSQLPTVGVIMMSVLNEPDVLRRAMLAGAREYLVKPFSLDELLSSIRNVHQSAPRIVLAAAPQDQPSATATQKPAGQATVVTVASAKGGVGRSVIAANLAIAVRQISQQRVALVDADIAFGDVAVMMNVTGGKTLTDVVGRQRTIDSELVATIATEHASGVHLILPPETPQEAELVTADIVRGLLQAMVDQYDVIIVDTRPGFDDINLSIFDSSDVILLVVTMEMTAIKAARQFIEISDLLGYPTGRVRLVLNRQNSFSGIPAEEIGESLRRPIWATIQDEPGPMLRSVNEGVPLVSQPMPSKAADELNRIAHEIMGDASDPNAQSNGDRRPERGLARLLRVGRRGE